MRAKVAPLSKVEANSNGIVIRSVAIRTPVPAITSKVEYWPIRTIGFFGNRSATTPPSGVRNSIPTPLPIAANPEAA